MSLYSIPLLLHPVWRGGGLKVGRALWRFLSAFGVVHLCHQSHTPPDRRRDLRVDCVPFPSTVKDPLGAFSRPTTRLLIEPKRRRHGIIIQPEVVEASRNDYLPPDRLQLRRRPLRQRILIHI